VGTARTQTQQGQGRRHFLQAAGTGAAASLAAAAGWLAPRPATAAQVAREGKPPARRPFHLGLASYTLRKFNLDDTLRMTQRVDLKYICLKSFHLPLDSTPQQIAEVAAKVKRAGIKLYGGGVITMNNEAEVRRAFAYAKAAGMKTIIGAPAPRVLPLVDKQVRQYDIQVAIHNHGPGDKTYPTPQSVYERIKDLDRRIGLCMDVGHTVRIGADPVRSARRFAARLLDVHIKDVSEASPKGKAIEAGRGVIDFPGLLRTLIETNYSGVVAFEYEKDPDDPLPGLAESVGYVKGVLAVI
jgi:inosose dehydratase